MPPSVNALYVRARLGSKHGKAPSPQFRDWKKAAGPIVLAAWNAAGRPSIGKPYSVHIAVNLDHKGDIANREKPITDILVATIPGFPGDQWVNRMVIERDRTIQAVRVTVEA